MKKNFILSTFLFLLAGCSSTDEVTKFNVVTADKSVSLSAAEGSPQCNVHLELSYATEDNGHKAEIINNIIEQRLLDMQDLNMQEAADSFANEYTAQYRTLLPLYNQDRGDGKKADWYNYHYILKTDVEQGYEGTSVYHAYLDYYEGGAHGVSQHLTINFEKSTGRQLMLADLFVPGYEHQLSAILQKALCAYAGVDNLNELKEQGYLYSMDMFPSENFIRGKDVMTFIYNPYEIAPYEKGCIELKVSYTEIDGLLSNSL